MTAPLLALSVPLLDTGLSIARRFLRLQPIFGADRNHIHHRLLDRGLTAPKVVMLLYACCALGCLCSIAVVNSHTSEAGLIAFLIFLWFGVNALGYVEFGVVARLLNPRNFSPVVAARVRLLALERTLAAATTADDCWNAVRTASKELGFSELCMRINGTLYHERFSGTSPGEQTWTTRVPLSATEFINVGHKFHDPKAPTIMAPFATILHRALVPKLDSLRSGKPQQSDVIVFENAS